MRRDEEISNDGVFKKLELMRQWDVQDEYSDLMDDMSVLMEAYADMLSHEDGASPDKES